MGLREAAEKYTEATKTGAAVVFCLVALLPFVLIVGFACLPFALIGWAWEKISREDCDEFTM